MGVTEFPTVVLHPGPLSFVNPFNSSQIITSPPNPILVYGSDYVTTGGGSPSIGNSVWLSTDHAATFSIISGVGPTIKAAYPYNISSFGNLYSEGVGFITQNGTLLFVSINFLFDVWASETGTAWRKIFIGQSTPYSASLLPIIDYRSDTIYLLTCTNQNIYSDVWISTDIGHNFRKQNVLPIMSASSAKVCTSPPAFFSVPTITAVAQLNNITNVLVIAGGGQRVFSSTNDVWMSSDRGASFIQVTTTATWSVRNTITSMVTRQGLIILGAGWASASYSDLYVSMDGGFTFGWCSLTASSFVPFWSRFFIDELGFLYVAGGGLFRRTSFSFFNLTAVAQGCGVALPRCGPGVTCLPGASTTQYTTVAGQSMITCPLVNICTPYDYTYVTSPISNGSSVVYTDGAKYYYLDFNWAASDESTALSAIMNVPVISDPNYDRLVSWYFANSLIQGYGRTCSKETILTFNECVCLRIYTSYDYGYVFGRTWLASSPLAMLTTFRPLHQCTAAAINNLRMAQGRSGTPLIVYRGGFRSDFMNSTGHSPTLSIGEQRSMMLFTSTSTNPGVAYSFFNKKIGVRNNPAAFEVIQHSLTADITTYTVYKESEELAPPGVNVKILSSQCDQLAGDTILVYAYDVTQSVLPQDQEKLLLSQLQRGFTQWYNNRQSTILTIHMIEQMIHQSEVQLGPSTLYMKRVGQKMDKHNQLKSEAQASGARSHQDTHPALFSNGQILRGHLQQYQTQLNTLSEDLPLGWTCPANYYNATDGCDCGCGAVDPDCLITMFPIFGCNLGASPSCSLDTGVCQYFNPPSSWSCASNYYNSSIYECDCQCGAIDPDCNNPHADAEVYGCAAGQTCDSTSSQCTGDSYCQKNNSNYPYTKIQFSLLVVLHLLYWWL
jgi:hypothetical protein